MARRKFAKLKAIMYEREVTQEELASLLKHSMTYISRRFNGHEPFTTHDIVIISNALELPLNECSQYFFE